MYYYVRPEWSLSYLMHKSKQDVIEYEKSTANESTTSNQKEIKTFLIDINNNENFKETPKNEQQQLKSD